MRETTIEAYLCRVLQLSPPLEIDRDPIWFSASRAKRRLRECQAAKCSTELGAWSISIARNLERVADHATNIAEDAIFWVCGVDVRRSFGKTA